MTGAATGVADLMNDNQEMLELLADPLPETVHDVLRLQEKLQVVAEKWPRGTQDGLASFNYLYHIITKEVFDRLDAGTSFQDSEFLARLDVEFARRYFHAIRVYASGAQAPHCWQVLFDSRSDPEIDPMRFAVAGVNAHVDYDLAFSLVTTYEVLSRPITFDERTHSDYQTLNDIFAQYMRQLRRHFESRSGRALDAVFFDALANDAGDLTVVVARDLAWHRAQRLWSLEGEPAFDCEGNAIDWRASMLGRAILTYGRWP
jgi:hypothetical protein